MALSAVEDPDPRISDTPARVSTETASERTEFTARTAPFRRELLAHCYRMLGSIHDAEDLVQETYLRAWRSFDRFEERSSVRVWLYKIATMACLTELNSRRRRPLPSGLGGPSDDPRQPLVVGADIPWLQPAPDALIAVNTGDPAAIAASRAGIRLAFIAALQYLPARQRAVLILRDVLGWHASEVAETLEMSTAAANSALQRARGQLARSRPVEDEIAEPTGRQLQSLLDDYVNAFERADLTALLHLMRADVELEMPPTLTWFTGRDAVIEFFSANVLHPDAQWRLVLTRANGQPAVVVFGVDDDGEYQPHGVQVFTTRGDHIARITSFNDPELVAAFM